MYCEQALRYTELMIKKVMVIYAHPGQRHSTVNTELAAAAACVENITFVDLYARYPRFDIDIDKEQQALLDHDIIVLQFPVFWYSMPSLLKEWIDLVLEFGFAYGTDGDKLVGKWLLPAITAGGTQDAYQPDGANRFSIRTLFSPLEQTAYLCQLQYIPPLVLFGALRANQEARVEPYAQTYKQLLEMLRDERFDLPNALNRELLLDTPLPTLKGI